MNEKTSPLDVNFTQILFEKGQLEVLKAAQKYIAQLNAEELLEQLSISMVKHKDELAKQSLEEINKRCDEMESKLKIEHAYLGKLYHFEIICRIDK